VVAVIWVGLDWAEEHHQVEVQSEAGQVLERFRVDAGVAGVSELHRVLSRHAEQPEQVVVGVEASHGLLVNALVGSGYAVYPIPPKMSARAREGDSPANAKSDFSDAHLLANLVRTRRDDLRPLAGDSELAQEVRIRARSHLRAVRQEQRLRGQLRSELGKYFPAGAELLNRDRFQFRDALAVLSVATSPEQGRRLSLSRLRTVLHRHGRSRNLDSKAAEIQTLLRAPQLELDSRRLVAAYSDEVSYLVRMLVQLASEIAELESQLATAFKEHPDAEIHLSLPGLGNVLGARVLGESGDDPARYLDGRARKNYCGNSPITRASGKSRTVGRRVARNRILADAVFLWAEAAIRTSPGARRYYDSLRQRGKAYHTAIRAIANRLAGILHACLRQHRLYDEATAWPVPGTMAA
jgi:hypothetical protein